MISEGGYFLQHSVPPLSASTNGGIVQLQDNYPNPNPNPNPNQLDDAPSGSINKRKRNLPRTPDPEVEVVAMSPKTLMATNRFICEICNKGFQRDQNLQLHRRGHNLPWKLKQKAKDQPIKKKVYVCPEKSCVHNDPSRALGDLTGIKKHFSRKHGEKKWKCDKCSKKYAVMSDWKAHTKICGTREYKCDCGTIFSRKDSFITHRAFCDALTEERMRVTTNTIASALHPNMGHDLSSSLLVGNRQSIPSFSACQRPEFLGFEPSSSTSGNNSNNMGIADNPLGNKSRLPLWLDHHQVMNSDSFLASSSSIGGSSHVLLPEFSPANLNLFTSSSSSIPQETPLLKVAEEENSGGYNHASELFSLYSLPSSSIGNMSATALLQKAAQIGSTRSNSNSTMLANVSGMMRSSSFSSPSVSNNLANLNNVDIFHQKQIFRQQINHQMASLQGYSTTTNPLTTTSNNKSASDGMRDFLGTLGGGARNDVDNNGGVQERRVLLQEEMAYKFATIEGSHDHQEPYKDLMR